eukprot:10912016-Prorocentrum_lima.AAC.1
MLIKWHTGSQCWWRTPGGPKKREIWEEIHRALDTPGSSIFEISMAPHEADILMIASEYGVGPDWEFMNLHPNLTEQLD